MMIFGGIFLVYSALVVPMQVPLMHQMLSLSGKRNSARCFCALSKIDVQ